MRYDVIVVGAGPAGSTAARECASRGLSVLMLDRAEFPRDKPCGGGVTVRASELLPFSIEAVTERTINGLHLSVRDSRGFTRYADHDLAYLTQRSRLDTFLADQAIETGVTLKERAPIRELERHDTHVVVRAGSEIFEGSTLVAADGANGQTARMAGINVNLLHGIAIEGNITPRGGFPERWEHVIGLNMCASAGGYGWI
ncbi:MAG: NAD(P)/FAD-dependent oxidoreductase, partial [Ardenticatenaceae bacterium]